MLTAKLLPSNSREPDPLQKGQHCEYAWRAVCYRYRTCSECNEELKELLINAPARWREWNDDHEHTFKVERCLYVFFMNGLSVFESLGFCLYFVGGAIQPDHFRDMGKPKRITLEGTSRAFTNAFPETSLSVALADLPNKDGYRRINEARNILAHRLPGMRSLRDSSTIEVDGTYTHTSEDVWHIMGMEELPLGEELLQHHMDGITSLLNSLTEASIEFLRDIEPAKA